ncbi:DUF4383 domain-containing protein [Pseudonocardia sp. KRD291]|uniref:DUF4383 domain-containing protein n=1 Tax=Pseudonocardia sp. KRD291 TaxID=2792007 RepID=UPI001C49E1F7|nr:DUF4383 domain-containing protein [Pseudonocardia sp. KRD291]MBW0100869.1 DUF4383 domain-containing protein [Pseudonocardia sp. KRD291]
MSTDHRSRRHSARRGPSSRPDHVGGSPQEPTSRIDAAAAPPTRLHRSHRVGAAGFGLVLCAFGVLGFLQRLDWFSTQGEPIAGLSTNGLLSMISVIVGALLIAAALRGPRTASTALVVIGAAFMLSGVANVLVLTTPLNILAFTMNNVIFSLVAGALLLIAGAWGRFTGRLPPDNPYRRERHPNEGRDGNLLEEQPVDGQGSPVNRLPTTYTDAADVADVRDMAEAERAAARGAATPTQAKGLTDAAQSRRGEDRLQGWRRHLRRPQR